MKVGILLCVALMTVIEFSNAKMVKCYNCVGDSRDRRLSNIKTFDSYNNCRNPGRMKNGTLLLNVTDCDEGCKTVRRELKIHGDPESSHFDRSCLEKGDKIGCDETFESYGTTNVCNCKGELCNSNGRDTGRTVKCYKCFGDTRNRNTYMDCKHPPKDEDGKLSLPVMDCVEGCRKADEVVDNFGHEYSLFARSCLRKNEKIECEKVRRYAPNDNSEICNCKGELCNGGDFQRISLFVLSIASMILISLL